MHQKKTVFILDDHPMFREGLKATIECDAGFEVVGEADNAKEGLRMAGELNPDLVLMDISLPGQSGIQLTHEIRKSLPNVKVMIVSMHSGIDYIAGAFQAGAAGYMVKDSASEKLLHGLESISRGEYFLDSLIFPQVIDLLKKFSNKKVVDAAYNALSEREQEVMVMLAEGFSITVIAERLFISPKTVKNHRASIMSKLDIHSAYELMHYAAKIGLIDVDLWKD